MDKTGRLNYIELGIDDMTNLVELSDESLLYNLETRYAQKIIYTYIGSILISINPYTELNIYDKKHISRYQNKSMQEVPPHLFGIAEINYSKMMMENENQVIVISGESGAGKTEAFKRILKYLAFTSGGVKELQHSDRDLSNDIANKILDSTPLLESFGNAKTIRNDNSSRFGKYVEIFFDNGVICGSRTTNYLLEKSRIVNINPDERGYHIFYELLQGLDSFGKSQYYFKNVSDYAYLNNAKNFSVKGRDDAAHLKEFMSQWSTLGLSNADLDIALRIVSAVLNLGNIRFGEDEEASYLLEKESANIVAKMLKVDMVSLINCLTKKTTDTVKDTASSPVNAEHACNLRDTLAKHLYSELFDWIVAKVNESLNKKTATLKRTSSHLDRSLNAAGSKFRCIAMLDIYGFENFPENSLEQLCINYANETLQQFFNRYVFELEQAEYKQEGISWHYVTYPDNQPIINLLSAKPSGIIQILNDECSIPQGSDEGFLTKCDNVHRKNDNFEKPKKIDPPQFIIRHFAGQIYYTVTGFLDKNRDIIRKDAIKLIEHCGVEEIAIMFQRKKEKTIKNPNIKARTPAVMADFQNSLMTLLNKMKSCQPWFIRCLKPNKKKEPLSFDKEIVMDQMRYTGILETVKIRKSGFPIRIPFNIFLSRFYLLQSKDMRRYAKEEPQQACLKMLPKFGGQKGKEFEVGKSKLFFKETFARYLETQVRVIRERSAIKIQKRWRAYWKVRLIIIRNRAATKLQSIARGFIARRRIKRLHVAIVKLQSFVRMQLVRQKFITEHPEFLKYSYDKPESGSVSKGTATTYKFPAIDVKDKSTARSKKKAPQKFNYNLLKIPIKLAFLLETSTENYGHGHLKPKPQSINERSPAQHLFNRNDIQLPSDINEYQFDDFVQVYGNNITFESKAKPIQNPFLLESMSATMKDDSLNAHKLLLRLVHVNTMPWLHQYLAGSYLSHMASTSPQLQMEIIVQIISETVHEGPLKGHSGLSSDVETRRLGRAWTLLGNLLGHLVLVPQIFAYVLKYVSTAFGVDQACTCQDKLLQFVHESCLKVPRLYPASNLEWRANMRGSKMSLTAIHPDDARNSVHVNSFTTAETFANHSLCFRFKKFKVNNGWSLSLITRDFVIDCSGHNYVVDVIAGVELPSCWEKISGYSIGDKFLLSKTVSRHNTVNSNFLKSQLSRDKSNQNLQNDNRSFDTIASRKTMDSWVDKYFNKSFIVDEIPSFNAHNYIHGLEEDLKLKQNVYSPANANGSVPHNTDATSLSIEEQLKAAELQQKLIQTSIDNELLQQRLLELQQKKPINQSASSSSHSRDHFHGPTQNDQGPNHGHHFVQNPLKSGSREHQLKSDSIPRPVLGQNTPNVSRYNDPMLQNETFATARRRSLSHSDHESQIAEFEKTTNLKKKRSVVKYSEVAPASEIVVDDSTILPELKKKSSVSLSQLRAAEIPKVSVANRAAFLNKFFEEKTFQSPQTTKRTLKRNLSPAPVILPTQTYDTEPYTIPKSRSHEEPVSLPTSLIPQSTLIPRPVMDVLESVSESDNVASLDEEINLQDPSIELSNSITYLDEPVNTPALEVKRRKKRLTNSGKTAALLSSLPGMHYSTYTNVPWFLMVKIELFLPKEIRESTILNPIIFCQIVRDLTEFPCVRWIGNERFELLSMIGNIGDTSDVKNLLSTPSNLMLKVIDRAQNCELYFSRFYSIKWPSTDETAQVSYWLAISHSGIRFVEHDRRKPEFELKIDCRIPYSDMRSIVTEDHDIHNNCLTIVIRTKSNKKYIMTSSHALSAMNLVHEFIQCDHEGYRNNSLSSTYRKKTTSRKLPDDDELLAMKVTTFDVNRRRVPMMNLLDSGPSVSGDDASSIDTCGNLIEFMICNSKYKVKSELEDTVLRWQNSGLGEPLLPKLNNNLTNKAIELFDKILILTEDVINETSTDHINCGINIFKTLSRNKELTDEVILQIMKQIIGNPKSNSRIILWNLVSTIILFFGVTKRLEPYLLQHFRDMMKDQINADQKSIISTMKVLQKVVSNGIRKEMPLDNELRYLLDGIKDAKMTIYIPNDAVESYIRFNNTVAEVIKNICRSYQVTVEQEISDFSLVMVEVNDLNKPIRAEEYLDKNSYLFDFITRLAKNKINNTIFYFSRSSWTFSIVPIHKSDEFINLTFNQLSKDVLCEKWMEPQTNSIRFLKPLAEIAYFNLRGQGHDIPINDGHLQSIFPIEFLGHDYDTLSKSELINLIESISKTIDTSLMTKVVDYQKKFIELVMQLPFYGWIKFPIHRFTHLPSSNNLTINFTPVSIIIYNDSTHEIIMKIALSTFSSFHWTKIDAAMSMFTLTHNGRHEIQFIAGNNTKLVFLLDRYQKIRSAVSNRRS